MAYLNGKRVLFTVIKNGSVVEEVQYEFFVRPKSEADGIAKLWEPLSASRYSVKITPDEFPNISNPYVAYALRYEKDGDIKQTILDSKRLVNDTLIVYVNEPIICKIIIKGENK